MTRTLDAAWRGGTNHFHLIRLIAAWLVIYSHAWAITGAPGTDHLGQLTGHTAGGFAVDVFFTISGFLIAASYERNRWQDFLLARALRIFPALIVCVALATCVLGPWLSISPDYWRDAKTWHYAWGGVTLIDLQFWLPGVFDALPRTAVNGSLWTLPIEVRLYLALFFAGLIGMLHRWRYLAGWALAIGAACAFAWKRAPLPEYAENLIWVTAFFITGTLCWVWRERIRLSLRVLLALIAACAFARGSIAFIPCYFATVAYGTFVLAFLPGRPWIRHNDLSYGIYLYGWPMQQLALMAGATTILSNIVAGTALALCCAALSWFAIERPALAWHRRRANVGAGERAARA